MKKLLMSAAAAILALGAASASANAAAASEPHGVATYLRELAGDFHTCYNAHKVLVDEPGLRHARVALCQAVRQVIANGLGLLGVTAPETM